MATRNLDFTQPPLSAGSGGSGAVLPRTTAYQFLHRDPTGPAGTSAATSDGLQVTFCP